MNLHRSFLILAAATVTSCRTMPPPPTQFSVPPVDVQPLVGDWRGEYVADGPAERHGSLTFALVGGNTDAHGELSMTPAGGDRAYERYRSEQSALTSAADTTPRVGLPAIQFVRLAGPTVSGTIDAYVDPDCQCPAIMTLQGKLQNDTIDGTFRATYDGQKPDLIGKWSVKRTTTR